MAIPRYGPQQPVVLVDPETGDYYAAGGGAFGTTSDTLEDDPNAADATVISLLRGILAELQTIAANTAA